MKIARRQYRTQYNANPVRSREIAHGRDIVQNLLQSFFPGVLGDVICASQQDHYFRRQFDDILTKTDKHLRGSLPRDAAVYIRLTRKKFTSICSRCCCLLSPAYGDGISHEHNAGFARRWSRQRLIGVSVLRQERPVIKCPRSEEGRVGNLTT